MCGCEYVKMKKENQTIKNTQLQPLKKKVKLKPKHFLQCTFFLVRYMSVWFSFLISFQCSSKNTLSKELMRQQWVLFSRWHKRTVGQVCWTGCETNEGVLSDEDTAHPPCCPCLAPCWPVGLDDLSDGVTVSHFSPLHPSSPPEASICCSGCVFITHVCWQGARQRFIHFCLSAFTACPQGLQRNT